MLWLEERDVDNPLGVSKEIEKFKRLRSPLLVTSSTVTIVKGLDNVIE